MTARFGGTVPHHDYLKKASSPGILSSTFPEEMNLQLQILVFGDTPAIYDGSTMAHFLLQGYFCMWGLWNQEPETIYQYTLG